MKNYDLKRSWKELRRMQLENPPAQRECNLCENRFTPRNRFIRFCDECRRTETYRTNEWVSSAQLTLGYAS